jgi:tRNA uridine 5-carbamoylmethylation protein Kti12
MKRLVIMTVGKTHSGKTTFARGLEKTLKDSAVIDQDNHAEFINTYYRNLLPKQGPNTLKNAVSQTIVDFAVKQTDFHLIICNSNRNRKWRLELLEQFVQKGFTTVLVHFDIPDDILQRRIDDSQRSTKIFRSASAFSEVLVRQQADSLKEDVVDPVEGEADHLFVLRDNEEADFVMKEIEKLTQR